MADRRLEIRSEERGSHWVAWLAAGAEPAGIPPAVLMVGKTQEEAEQRMREWWQFQRGNVVVYSMNSSS
jgi:hypothetical protein